jgi:cell division protein FtsZ
MSKQIFNSSPVKIKVIGIGGGGCNAVTRMIREQVRGVEFVAMNTDAQALQFTEAPIQIQLGEKSTRGLGAGGDNRMGEKAAEENRDEIKSVLSGSDMVFITCGMGGGTGTGAAPVVAEIAKQMGALTIAVVTKPFTFEGTHRRKTAEDGIAKMTPRCDTLIMIPNDRLLDMCNDKTGIDSAFKMADDVLRHGVQAISEVVTVPGLINLDFADVRAITKDAGPAWMSIGTGSGKNRAIDAAKEALASPLLDVAITGARGVLFNVVGGDTLTLYEVNEAAEIIKKAVDPAANIIFGVAKDERLDNEVRITLIATGFNSGSSGNVQDDALSNMLKEIKTEDEFDVPSFLRRPAYNQQRSSIPKTREVTPQQAKQPVKQNSKRQSIEQLVNEGEEVR